MMSEMMKQCCGDDGMPNFEKMKQFMEQCGKKGFKRRAHSYDEGVCAGKDMLDFEKMKAMMEKCGCHIPEPEVSQ